jgi:hypothetical protein
MSMRVSTTRQTPPTTRPVITLPFVPPPELLDAVAPGEGWSRVKTTSVTSGAGDLVVDAAT